MSNKHSSKCPNCGKVVPTIGLRQVKFCDRMCEVNYRYRMRHVDPRSGDIPSPEFTKQWKTHEEK